MAGLLSGYSSTIADAASRKRYAEELELVGRIDPYEVAKGRLARRCRLAASNHATSGVYVPHPSSESLLRKGFLQLQSLDCYQNFVRGWVRQVLVKPVRDKRIVIGKDSLS